MESNAHRRSIGMTLEDALPSSSTITHTTHAVLASLTFSQAKKRLRPAVESKIKIPRAKKKTAEINALAITCFVFSFVFYLYYALNYTIVRFYFKIIFECLFET